MYVFINRKVISNGKSIEKNIEKGNWVYHTKSDTEGLIPTSYANTSYACLK